MVKIRSSLGPLKHWEIDRAGNVWCSLDDEYIAPIRITGKKKLYRQVQLNANGTLKWFYVHRIMALSWLPRPNHPKLRIVDHKDGNSLNNNIENLRWVTVRANNINKKCFGCIFDEGMYTPRIMGYCHHRFASADKAEAQQTRDLLAECYVRYLIKFPGAKVGSIPHFNITKY